MRSWVTDWGLEPISGKSQKGFCNQKAVAKSQTSWLQSCLIYIFSIWHMTWSFLYTRSFRCTHLSVVRYRLTKNGFVGPKGFWGFLETVPSWCDHAMTSFCGLSVAGEGWEYNSLIDTVYCTLTSNYPTATGVLKTLTCWAIFIVLKCRHFSCNKQF